MNIHLLFLSMLALCALCSAQFVDEMQAFDECFDEDVFSCMAGGCIPLSEYCDGVANCEDGSDENFCVDHPPDAKLCNDTHQFLCTDQKKCIPEKWICNRETDCDDGSDELNCTNTVATDENCKGFRCNNGKCISSLWVCDGVYDCDDKSDEDNQQLCRQALLPHTILDGSYCQELPAIGERNYKCIDSSFCLPASMMCDGMKDCRDGTDEGPFCKNWHAMCNNNKCSGNGTICSPDRYGPTCLCLTSSRSYNSMTHECDDVNECLFERPQCSHKCVNGDGHFQCECDKGYKKDDFGYLCYAKGPEAMLFFTTKNEIKFLKIKSKQLVTVATGLKQAYGVSYDGKYLYWVEAGQGHQSIVRAHLEDIEGTKEVLAALGLEDPGDIAIDWLGGNIYFSDTARGSISACRFDGSVCSPIQTHAKFPKFLTLDPRNGKMYWADWLNRAVIMSANMDGTSAEVLVDNLEVFASGLAVDSSNERLYYVERTVRVVMLQQKIVYSLFDEPFHHPYAISVFENTVYWSDWTTNSIQSTDKLHGSQQKRNVILSLKTPVFGMHMYHPALLQSTSNPCLQHNCTHLCLVTSNATSVCACPVGMQVKGNGCEHVSGFRPEYLIVSGGQQFTRIQFNSLGNPESHATHFDVGRTQAMAYDSLRDTLYIYDGQRRQISYINMSDFTLGMPHTLLYQGLDNVVDMDYDYATDSLYFLDAGRRLVEVVSLRTKQRALVYQFKDGEIPISLCIMSDIGLINMKFNKSIVEEDVVKSAMKSTPTFVIQSKIAVSAIIRDVEETERMLIAVVESESSYSIHIDSVGLDGAGRYHVIMNDLKGPHVRLKYAQFLENVFVSDEGNGIIDFMHPEGTGRENFRQLSTTVTSLAVTDTYVFWTDRRTARLFWTHVHEATNRARRMDLSMFPNTTQLLIQATSRHPADTNHPCLTIHPCSDVCVQTAYVHTRNVHTLGYKCLCPPGRILENGQCVEVVECKDNELYCHRSNACVDNTKRCDGVNDCTFGEDESYCTVEEQSCNNNQFRCHNSSLCIERTLICDSHVDCPDGSDELQSACDTMACFESEFMCASGSCIMKTWKCDGDNDCNDATDEIGCENLTCKPGYYQCRNKECIAMKRRCDGQQDCFDLSDEEDCGEQVIFEEPPEESPQCAVYEFACEHNTSICLPLTARCNMKTDCPGATDEDGCDFRCTPHGMFACQQQLLCVGMSKLCDGRKDCDDGSDETPTACDLVNKTSHLHAPAILPASECLDGFLCPSAECLEWMQVCDNVSDCTQGDEGQHCSTACANHSCSHACQPTPQGPLCVCPPGYHHAGPNICEDIDECAFDACSHTCINIPGSFICYCHHGYALRSDRRSCKAIQGNMSILFVSGNTVRSVSADGYGAVEFSDPAIATLSGMDYNVRKNKLYVTSADSRKLIEVNGTHNTVMVTNIGRPTKVAVEWITGNVYFVDSTPGDQSIKVCNVAKKRCAKLLKLPTDAEVTSLIVDPKSRLIFYCITRALESVVWSASLSGLRPRDLSTVAACTGLAADSDSKRLYVAETGPHHIIHMDYDGLHHKVILSNEPELQAPHGLALFEDHIYFLVANSFRLSRCLLFGKKHCETYIYRVFDANTFVIRHASTQRTDVVDSCVAGKCGGVCVLGEKGGVCLCDDGGVAKDGGCGLLEKDKLPLFNGWSYQDYARAQNVSLTVVGAALALLAIYIALFVYYHFMYKPRKNRKSAYTEVRYQTNMGGAAAALSYPTVDMATDASLSHEFVNPLQYVRDVWQQSFRKPKPVGTAGLTIDLSQSPPPLDYSDTESEFDDKQLIIRRK